MVMRPRQLLNTGSHLHRRWPPGRTGTDSEQLTVAMLGFSNSCGFSDFASVAFVLISVKPAQLWAYLRDCDVGEKRESKLVFVQVWVCSQ